ncbi:MAG TPA: hypothetical protein CFH81_02105 [Sulfurovum sp. UBA12169]|nr:MAG TPA: hypothetical protein CFH81_02105 [Sulfurovum sp. UBA12169]
MRGEFSVEKVRTREDYEALIYTDKQIFRELLAGTIAKQRDIAVYPNEYSWELQEGDEGHIAPILEDYEDLTVIERFGFTKEEVVR